MPLERSLGRLKDIFNNQTDKGMFKGIELTFEEVPVWKDELKSNIKNARVLCLLNSINTYDSAAEVSLIHDIIENIIVFLF